MRPRRSLRRPTSACSNAGIALQGLDDPTGYLFVTAMNVFRKRLRRAGIAVAEIDRHGAEPGCVRRRGGSTRSSSARLAQLPLDQRAALVVTALLGYSSEEAGQMLGIQPSTVRARATRGRTALRELIGEER